MRLLCPEGRDHPSPALSVALACSPPEYLSFAVHIRVMGTVTPDTEVLKPQISSPSPFAGVVCDEFGRDR